MADKIETLIGFAIRANKIIYGIDNIEILRKKRYLIVVCNSLSERTLKRVMSAAQERKIPVIRVKHKLLEDVVHKTQCKVIAVKDNQMSTAIMKYINENYEVLTSEVE